MKKLLLVVCILIISSPSFAQQYVPMPTDSAWWMYGSADWNESALHLDNFMVYVNGEDTSWDGTGYRKLMLRKSSIAVPNGNPIPTTFTATQPDIFIGGYRENNKVVYVRKAGGVEEEFFDHNHQVGDILFSDGSTTKSVTSIDQILIGSSYRKRIAVSITPGNTIETYVEGIGCYSFGIIEINAAFNCYQGEQYYNNGNYVPGTNGGPTDDCIYILPFTTTNVSTPNGEEQLSIYPNPVHDLLSINSHLEGTAAIYNTIGQVVYSHAFNKGIQTIDVSQFSQGVYHIVLRDERNAVIATQKLMKQ